MTTPRSTASAIAFLIMSGLVTAPSFVTAQDAGFGDPSRLANAEPVGARAMVDWDDLITEVAGGATEPQFHDAVAQTFEQALEGLGVALDPDASRFLLCRVETLYDSGLIAFAARVELHEPSADGDATVITWHRTWIGTTPARGMHTLFTIGEQCAEDFVAARDGA
jgi:hypothetical protein